MPGQHEHHAGERRDAAGGVAHERAEREPEEPDEREEERAPDDGAQHVRARRSSSARGAACQDRLRDEEREQRRGQHQRERRRPSRRRPSPTARAGGAGRPRSVERIMPVEYSPVITSTPSTPIASCAMCQPPSAACRPGRSVSAVVVAHLRPVRHLHGARTAIPRPAIAIDGERAATSASSAATRASSTPSARRAAG